MKITAVVATSKNGYITNGEDPDPRNWTSDEDKAFLVKMLKTYPLHIMGAKTYEYFKPNPSQFTHIIVLTRNPKKYQAETKVGKLDFIDLDLKTLLATYSQKYESCLVLGGSQVYSDFLDADLVDELYVTIEPRVHTAGIPFLTGGRTLRDLDLPEPEITNLNDHGTLLYHYQVH